MGDSEAEINLCSIGEPKLHGGMCKILSDIYVKVLAIFPDLEAARPRSTTGIQALCTLHIALEKTKNILQHCAECSKLYLAITGDSVVLKLERARSALHDGLRRVEDIVPQTIGCQISKILSELEGIEFSIDPTEKQVGDDIIALLQQGRKFNSKENDNNELETFHQSASRLGITSSRAILRERRALRKIIERAQADEDKRKESIVAYLMHLLSKYSKLFRTEVFDDNDSQCSTPCSPTIQGFLERHAQSFDQQPLSKPNSFNFKPKFGRSISDQIPIPPEELRCPISLQLMYDPVIIASGQTYERICIEKWFDDGHKTCPKTQQELPHLGLTCNYCVKGLVGSWCELNGLPIPDGPPESLDLNYWRLAFSENESSNSISSESIGSCKLKAEKENECQCNAFERYDDILTTLKQEVNLTEKCKAVEQIRNMVKDDVEVRIYMGANGFIEALMLFLESALEARNGMAQEIGAMALFNLGVDNNRNKGMMLAAGVLPLLEKIIAADSSSTSIPASTALCLNLSCHEEAKLVMGTSKVAVPFLIRVLRRETTGPTQCQLDALHALFNLSTNPTNIPHLMSSGVIDGLLPALSHSGDCSWVEKCVAIIINLASNTPATDEIISKPGLISGLSSILDSGGPTEQEQAAACLVMLCSKNEKCCEMVLQEGVVPSLVSISVNGTVRGKQKAQKLLMLFRDQRHRQKEPPRGAVISTQPPQPDSNYPAKPGDTPKPLCKSASKRKLGKALSFLWKNKSFSVYQC
ncbi:unnamed protein product [Cuscuta campestris]|uniref:RING-type E3 ubiquitin transferase n=1 Tax=Cuscuta campestris TaxID=132261 RepID=A0A484L576_9ASTE|nr:unnamed protein product [Cuscuta campestris]